MKKVLGIVGSKRKNGNTAFLVNQALSQLASKDIQTECIYLSDYSISGCTGCEGCQTTYKCIIKDDMQQLYPLIEEADAIIMGSPTYFYNVSSDVKTLIERLYPYQVFDEHDRSVWSSVNEALGGKYAVVIAICEQQDKQDMGFTSLAMKLPLEALGYRVVEIVEVLKLFNQSAASTSNSAQKQAIAAGIKLKKTLALKDTIKRKLNT